MFSKKGKREKSQTINGMTKEEWQQDWDETVKVALEEDPIMDKDNIYILNEAYQRLLDAAFLSVGER